MRKVIYIFLAIIFVSSISVNAQMKLKVPGETERLTTFGNHNLETNLKLELPPELSTPGSMEFNRGLFLLGLLADVTFPIGSDFSNFAGTGFSGHVLLAYMLSHSLMVTLSGGYISFGSKDFGVGQSFSQSFTHSQIPILLGLNYLFNMKGAFRAYLGLALGLYLLKDSYESSYTLFGETQTEEGSTSTSKFGVAPRLGFFFMAGAILLNMELTYSYIFGETSGGSNLQHLAVLAGVMFALGR